MASKEYMKRWRKGNREHLRGYAKDHSNQIARRARVRYETSADFLWIAKKILGCKSCTEHHPSALDFHHIDPSTKRNQVSLMKYCSMPVILSEIEKCECVCSNCHRKEHFYATAA